MLDRTDFESWQQRIRLYCLGKDNGENIMKSITEGIPKDIYTLINHYTDAKDIWDNVKMILEGYELTKDDRESQLYDEFERFCQIKGEAILFTIQHEVHANENRMMMERFIQPIDDPLALVSNASNQKYPTQSSKSPQFSNQPSLFDNCQMDTRSTSTDNLIESLTNTLALLRTSSNARNKATVQDDRVVVQDVQGKYNANNQGRPFQRNTARGNIVTGNAGGQNRDGNVNLGQAKPIVCYNCKGIGHIARELDDLALHVDHVFEADQCDAFDSDVDEAPTTQTMFMVNLSSEDPIYDEAGPSYDSNTPFEVQDHDTFVDHMDEYHEVHEMQSDVQHNYVVDSDADYTSDSNIIPYDQYVEDNEEHVVQSNVSSVRNDALMSILDEMHEQGVQSMSANKQVKVVNDTLTSELASSKEMVGVQTALFKEVKVMEEIFDQMNDEVDQNTVDKQCAEIERKNLLIANENLIANCLSNQLLYDVEKSRCLDLETEMSKVQNEIKHVSKLEREYLNLQLKYQHLQESFDNNKSQTSQEAPDFNSFFKIKNLEHQIQEKDNVIRDLKVLVSNVNDRNCEPYNANDVTALIEENECVRIELEEMKQHYKELFDSIQITRASTNEKTSSLLTQIEDLKAQIEGNLKVAARSSVKTKVLAPETVCEIVEEARIVKPLDSALTSACQYTKRSQELSGTSTNNTQKHEVHQKVQQTNVPMIHSTGVNSSTEASGSKPRSNTKKNRILPAD
ncbi:retrovirus-related pol polyprotein from transposon TNT 1-94 [Tanacetum coccineum]